MTINSFSTASEAGKYLSDFFCAKAEFYIRRFNKFTVVVPGGRSISFFWNALCCEFAQSLPWDKIHFFWTDERAVPAFHEDSNYGNAMKNQLSQLPTNIYPIKFTNNITGDCENYLSILNSVLSPKTCFDLAIIGMGADGHIASVFPGFNLFQQTSSIFQPSTQPSSNQLRLGFTIGYLAESENVVLFIIGKEKRQMLQYVLQTLDSKIPAGLLLKLYTEAILITDFHI